MNGAAEQPRVARVLAQAKVNLVLRVLAREQSGYHQLETVFQRLELGDAVTVRVGGATRSVDCAGPAMPAGGLGPAERNLAFRAAVAYADAAGWPAGFAIEIEKRIPVGGGLGGGSADAGAVLRALDALAPRALPPGMSMRIAASLGADVPFLTGDAPVALAWGRGERMLALPPFPPRDVLLVLPDFAVPTADAYAWLAEARAGGATTGGGALIATDALSSWAGVTGLATNDFEPVVSRRHPEIGRAVAALRAQRARIAMLSGSGSTIFGIFDAPPDAAAVTQATGCATLATRTATRVVEVERGD